MAAKKKISDYLKQEESLLVTKQPMVLTIDLVHYDKSSMRRDDDDSSKIWVKSLLAKAEFKDIIFDIVLDYAVFIAVYKEEKIGKDVIKLYYDANSTILEVSTEAAESKVQIQYVERLIGGREILKDASHLFRKLMAVYGPLSGMDSVHIEILESQVLRDKKNIQIPARLAAKWDPVLVNLKKVVFSEGFINGLAFENINDAIKTGLISEERLEPSVIEKVMTGSLVEDEGKSGRLGDRSYQNR